MTNSRLSTSWHGVAEELQSSPASPAKIRELPSAESAISAFLVCAFLKIFKVLMLLYEHE